jgi:hypothetical protein
MKKLGLAAVMAGTVFLGGCATYNQSQPTAALSGTVTAPLKADISVGSDITGTSSATIVFGLMSFGGDSKFADGVTYSTESGGGMSLFPAVNDIKAAAAYNAISSAPGSDIIIAPRYVIQSDNYVVYKTVTVTVTGKAGTIKSISAE